MRLIILVLAFLSALTPNLLIAGQKKPPPVSIRLYGEGNEKEGESFVMPVDLVKPPTRIFVRKIPVVSERDIKAFLPFPGQDGFVGAYFRLDAHGSHKLQQFTVEERGKLAVVMINGRASAALRVEEGVSDGIFFVPGGILPQEIGQLEQLYPIIGREPEFRKKSAKAKKERRDKKQKATP